MYGEIYLSFQLTECCVNVLVTAFKETILKECASMIKNNETESKIYILCDQKQLRSIHLSLWEVWNMNIPQVCKSEQLYRTSVLLIQSINYQYLIRSFTVMMT